MRNLFEILEDKKFYSMHLLNEMSTISKQSDNLPKSSKVCVYGEKDEPGTKVPHFHVIIDNGKIEFEIYIKNARELNIWRVKNKKQKTWEGYTNVKKAIVKWLDKENPNFRGMTNLEVILQVWNLNNPSNEIDNNYINF